MTLKRTTTDARIERFAWLVLRWRWPVMLITVAVAVVLASGARKLGFSDDYRLFFGPDNPQLQAFESLQDVYTKNDNIQLVIASRHGETIFTRETLDAIETLTEDAWQVPHSRRIDSITNFQHTRAEEDDLVVEDLAAGAATFDDEALAAVRSVALSEPLLRGRAVSLAGDVTAVNITLQLPGASPDETGEAVAHARALAAEFERTHPDLEVHITGFAMLNNAFKEASMGDLATLVPLMYAAILVFLALLFRSFSATLATLAMVALSTMSAMGTAGWLGFELTPPSAIGPTLVLTLAVADSVHILKGVLVRLGEGDTKPVAIVESLRVNLWPVFLTSVTTAIGFLSMNFGDSPPFHDLGNITAIGVTAAFVLSITFLPALISVLPLRARARAGQGTTWASMADWVLARRRSVLAVSVLVVVGLAAAVPRNELNDEFVEYFSPSIPFRVDTDFTVERLTGIHQIEYSLPAGESGGVSEPDYLASLDAFAVWWRGQEGVMHVRTLSDTMKRVNRSLHGDDPNAYRLPGRRALAAQYLLLYELSLPFGLDLNDEINVDKSATRFTITFDDLSAKELIAAAESGEAWLRENAPGSFARGVGPSLMFAHLTQRNINSMLMGTSIALVLISGLLVVALRSWRFGVLSLIPNLAPAIMAFGLWGLFVGQVNSSLSMVVAMTLGIVVDDTVHFLSKYLRGRREHGFNAAEAVRHAFATVGGALSITSAVLVTGFLVLSLSAFELNAGMGKLTAVTIVLALATDFLLLPALLVTFDRDQTADTVPIGATEPVR